MKKLLKLLIPNFILVKREKKWRIKEELENYTVWREKQYNDWVENGKKFPIPHAVKQRFIDQLQKQTGYEFFLETGTYLGEMVEAQKLIFKKIISIELGQQLYLDAKKKFAKDKNVTLFQGDSGIVLREIIEIVKEPAIFWLDGHYSEGITAKGQKNCPIIEELEAIFSGKRFKHILLIDDAACYTGEDDYPTIDEIKEYLSSKTSNYSLKEVDNVIVIEL